MSDATKQKNGDLYGVVAEFEGPEELKEGARVIRDARFKQWDCYSPFPVHGLDPAMGIKMTVLPWIVFLGGAAGLALGLGLQWWTNAYDWPWLVSGKPFWSIPANIPIAFETTILLAAFAAFFGMWALNRLPRYWHPFFSSKRFIDVTEDGFFIGIQAEDKEFESSETVKMLEEAGATNIELVFLDPDPKKKRIPRPVILFIIATTVLALIPFALITRARSKRSDKPHIHVIPDMDFQFKTKTQQASWLFEDSRGSRLPPEGTVARGELRADKHLYQGLETMLRQIEPTPDGGPPRTELVDVWAVTFPKSIKAGIDENMMARGQDRYNIFCQPCHGASGYGTGMIDKRVKKLSDVAWTPPTSLHLEHIVQMPHGQLFNTISNGVRSMKGYAEQIGVEDRWAIILYLRALQRSQLTGKGDAPDGKLTISPAPPPSQAPAPGDAGPPGDGGSGDAGPAAAGGDGGAPAAGGDAGPPAAPGGDAGPPAAPTPAQPTTPPAPSPAPADPGTNP